MNLWIGSIYGPVEDLAANSIAEPPIPPPPGRVSLNSYRSLICSVDLLHIGSYCVYLAERQPFAPRQLLSCCPGELKDVHYSHLRFS